MSRISRFLSRCISSLNEVYGREAEIYRDPTSGAVIADCRNNCARRIFLACGFERTPTAFRLRLPEGLSEAEQKARATQAMVHLIHAGHYTDIASHLVCDSTLAATWAEIRERRPDHPDRLTSPTTDTHTHTATNTQTAASLRP
ncbi:hypothetical protein [Streptomyces natalensis]|uniref:Uncharacterized protein n=1 Tax=Streptomyces natalensis ATCC 27448 TaxID=1240678 RepID=A0A0D7CGG7_9ACTN|nr:hypothetical protein [Streptomyces natalensis]KIZ14960.1 hypothetical protein SNA_29725 [Streptomyces natalensis ATCC 27448]